MFPIALVIKIVVCLIIFALVGVLLHFYFYV